MIYRERSEVYQKPRNIPKESEVMAMIKQRKEKDT
jgi:hypothetical protein